MLVAQALVMALSRALKNRTWAEARVFEQSVDPIDGLLNGPDKGKFALAVYVESAEGEPSGRETQNGSTKISFKVVAYMPPRVEVTEDDEVLVFEHQGAGFSLMTIARQIDLALHYGNETWVKLLRKLIVSIQERRTRFLLIEIENAIRIPSIEVLYEATCVAEPEMGAPLYGAWVDFDTALRAEDADLANIVKRLITEPADLPSWEQFQVATGLTDAGMSAMGLSGFMDASTEDGDVPVLTEVTGTADFSDDA